MPEPAHYVIAQYSQYQRSRNFSPLTIANRHHRLSAYAIWLSDQDPPLRLLEATHPYATAWLDVCHVSASTRNSYASALSAFYSWAVRYDLLLANPMAKVERAKAEQRSPRPTDDDDLTLALAYARDTDTRMCAWLYLTHFAGARCIEIARLRVEDIGRRAMSLRLFGKGNKERVIPLHPDVLDALVHYGLPASGFVFRKMAADTNELTADPLAPASVSCYIARFMHELGSSATAHQGRHWFGTNVHRESGGDLLVVRDLLGHARTASSEVYTRVDVTKAAPVVGRLTA